MDMTLVLGIFTFFYFVTLFLICFYRAKLNVKICNAAFIIADLIALSCWTFASYQKNWIGDGWLTLDNISPLTFTVIILLPFMKDWIKDYALSAIAFLNVGMFFAMLISPEHDYLFNFNREASFVYTCEALCHMICSLFGIYLVLSKQVKANFRQWVKSVIFLLTIITGSVILNFVYHRGYFGMDPYWGASIYMIDIFNGFWPTLIAYYFGVLFVLIVGMQGVYMLDKVTERLFVHEYTDEQKAEDVLPEEELTLSDGMEAADSATETETLKEESEDAELQLSNSMNGD